MSAITTFIERPDLAEQTADQGVDGFNDAASTEAVIAGQSASLYKFIWTRAVIAEWLRDRKWWMEIDKGEYVVRIDAPLEQTINPAMLIASNALKDRFPIWSTGNMKMATFSWDLPAGAPEHGGTCAAAIMGQPGIDPEARIRAGLTPDGSALRVLPPGATKPVPFREAAAICLFCYAEGKRMLYIDVQAAMILRQWWCEHMTAASNPDGREEWITVMVDSLTNPDMKKRPQVSSIAMANGRPFRAIRVHSSGDFFSMAYARAWVEVARRVAEVEDLRGEKAPLVFWAPTRTWALEPWAKAWPSILAPIESLARRRGFLNFVVRPSAYHVDDPAPFAVAEGNAGGTTSTSIVNTPRRGTASLYDLVCPAYATEDGGSCEQNGCRKCWLNPELRINYPLH